ncbi:hypothetical protein CDD82_2695 [Ophiocordyceps australis]|uniref:Ribosomal protein L5 C-terminal domain-containing protein n=1 Tax=Ophiocordyceps australis TaxID=1399860 RepID=A0A2C5ZGA5_9HYPO|nr:hypothetical protein CDD82_2695 [Ophiocordyceps australis]
MESTPTFTTPQPDQKTVEKFLSRRTNEEQLKLPGTRYQYHPPKYNRGSLHPIQSPPRSDPIARDFLPGPFNFPRLRDTYESTIAPDLLTLTYKHIPPGSTPPHSEKGVLRTWDDSSPYYLNRPKREPRGKSSRLPLLEREITFNHIPKLWGISVAMHTPEAARDKEHIHVARAIMQAITGTYPRVTTIKTNVASWKARAGAMGGLKTSLTGAKAYEFFDKLVTLVLPKIKDWPGVDQKTGDGSGNVAIGMRPSWMAYFPELEYNFDMYPTKLIPGCYIFIKTTATSDRQGKLLLQSLGLPFYYKLNHHH